MYNRIKKLAEKVRTLRQRSEDGIYIVDRDPSGYGWRFNGVTFSSQAAALAAAEAAAYLAGIDDSVTLIFNDTFPGVDSG